jgi:hypothetical protein
MKKLLLGLTLLISMSSFATEKLTLDEFRDTRFELNKFSISMDDYTGSCDREAIKDNTFANDSRELRSEGGLQEGANGYLFNDLERCSQLNFSIIIVKRVNFMENELKIGLYKAAWSKDFGFKPVNIDALYGRTEIDAKCSMTKEGMIFKDAHLNCNLLDSNGKKVGTMKFVEH